MTLMQPLFSYYYVYVTYMQSTIYNQLCSYVLIIYTLSTLHLMKYVLVRDVACFDYTVVETLYLLTTPWLHMFYVLLHKVAHCHLHFPILTTKCVALKFNLKFKVIKFDILLDASVC
jgi:hypothetical protein